MASFTGQTIATTYKRILTIPSENLASGTGAKYIEDGDGGTISCLSIGTTAIGIGTDTPANPFEVESDTEGTASGNVIYQASFGKDGEGEVQIGTHDGMPSISGQGTGSNYRLLLNPENGGNVGIGTISPDHKLEISSGGTASQVDISTYDDGALYSVLEFRKSDNDTEGTLAQTDSADAIGQIRFKGVDSGGNLDSGAHIYVEQSGAAVSRVPTLMRLETYSSSAQNTNQLVLAANGSVGIGTSTPAYKLQVAGAFSVADSGEENSKYTTFNRNTSDENFYINTVGLPDSSKRVGFQIDGGSKMSILQSGNVGIGSTNPDELLTIKASGSAPKLHITATNWEDDFGIKFSDYDAIADQNFELLFGGGTEDLRFKSNEQDNILYMEMSGDVGIGHNSPEHKLDVRDNADYGYPISCQNNAATDPRGLLVRLGYATGLTDDYYMVCQNDSSSWVSTILLKANGGIKNYQSNDEDFSDRNLKEDIVDAPSALNTINSLRVRNFKYKLQGDGKVHTGLIAQEVEDIDSSLVSETDEIKSIFSKELYHKMLKSIQELSTKVTALENA